MFVLEVTKRCNLNCMFCYNVWKCRHDYPKGEGTTQTLRKIIERLYEDARPKFITVSGGEPLLRNDLLEIVKDVDSFGMRWNLLTNGTLLTEQLTKEFVDSGVSLFEVLLLSSKPENHNKLTRVKSFEKTIDGILNIKRNGGKFVISFVATKINIEAVKSVAEFAIVLGAEGLMFNRFNPGGEGLKYIEELMPKVEEIKSALIILDDIASKYGIRVSSNIPIPPCIIDMKAYPHVRYGFCPNGGDKSYYTVDELGNIRICNHSPTVIGNILHDSFSTVRQSNFIERFTQSTPAVCKTCAFLKECNCCCKASAEAYYSSIEALDPFVARNIEKSL